MCECKMEKVAIIGCSGSGKSTFADRLQKKLDLPLYHLDFFYWKPNWERPPKEDWTALHDSIVAESKWIIDGNYRGTLDTRLNAADTIVFLKFSRVRCLAGVLRRFMRRKRIDEIPGCRERLDLGFIKWVWEYNRKDAPRILDKLRLLPNGKSIHILRNRRQLEAFYSRL